MRLCCLTGEKGAPLHAACYLVNRNPHPSKHGGSNSSVRSPMRQAMVMGRLFLL